MEADEEGDELDADGVGERLGDGGDSRGGLRVDVRQDEWLAARLAELLGAAV